MKLNKNDVVLFYGDSITDVDRNRKEPADLGNGYPKLVAETLTKESPELNLTFFNRGISGNKLSDLMMRLNEDCLALQPDVVSILIGINDVPELARSGDEQGIKTFYKNYDDLLAEISAAGARLVIMEPFLLGYPKERQPWRAQLDPLIQGIRKLALKYEAEYIPLDGLLNAAGIKNGHQTIGGDDGVHPTTAGHDIIKKAWLEIIEP